MTQFVPGRVASTFTPDRLIAGDFPIVTQNEVLVSGQNLTRGALLGRITTGGKLTLSLAAAADGSQTPIAILASDVNASGGDQVCGVYLSGEFNSAAMTFGTGHTAASTRAALRALGIYLKDVMPA